MEECLQKNFDRSMMGMVYLRGICSRPNKFQDLSRIQLSLGSFLS